MAIYLVSLHLILSPTTHTRLSVSLSCILNLHNIVQLVTAQDFVMQDAKYTLFGYKTNQNTL